MWGRTMGSREGFHGFDLKGRDWAFRVIDGEETGHGGGIRHVLALPCFAGASVPTLLQTCIAKENESIQLRIHFAVKPRPVCPSECVCKWRPGSRPSPCWNVLHSQHRQAEKTTSSAGSLKTNFVSQNASGRDAFPRSSRSDPTSVIEVVLSSRQQGPAMVALDQPGFTTLFPK